MRTLAACICVSVFALGCSSDRVSPIANGIDNELWFLSLEWFPQEQEPLSAGSHTIEVIRAERTVDDNNQAVEYFALPMDTTVSFFPTGIAEVGDTYVETSGEPSGRLVIQLEGVSAGVGRLEVDAGPWSDSYELEFLAP